MSQYHVPVAFLRVTQIDKLNAIMFYAAFESGNPAIIADPCSPGCLQCAYCWALGSVRWSSRSDRMIR